MRLEARPAILENRPTDVQRESHPLWERPVGGVLETAFVHFAAADYQAQIARIAQAGLSIPAPVSVRDNFFEYFQKIARHFVKHCDVGGQIKLKIASLPHSTAQFSIIERKITIDPHKMVMRAMAHRDLFPGKTDVEVTIITMAALFGHEYLHLIQSSADPHVWRVVDRFYQASKSVADTLSAGGGTMDFRHQSPLQIKERIRTAAHSSRQMGDLKLGMLRPLVGREIATKEFISVLTIAQTAAWFQNPFNRLALGARGNRACQLWLVYSEMNQAIIGTTDFTDELEASSLTQKILGKPHQDFVVSYLMVGPDRNLYVMNQRISKAIPIDVATAHFHAKPPMRLLSKAFNSRVFMGAFRSIEILSNLTCFFWVYEATQEKKHYGNQDFFLGGLSLISGAAGMAALFVPHPRLAQGFMGLSAGTGSIMGLWLAIDSLGCSDLRVEVLDVAANAAVVAGSFMPSRGLAPMALIFGGLALSLIAGILRADLGDRRKTNQGNFQYI